MLKLDLSNLRWTVRLTGDDSAAPKAVCGREFPAIVPGCIHTDLIRAGIIGDPRVGINELECQWVGRCDWEYRATFDVEPELINTHERLDLVFDGLDTITEITLNGQSVGEAANMFHPHRFDVRGAIKVGANELEMTFRSPLKHIRAEEAQLGTRPYNGDGLGEAGGWVPFQFIRKAASNFGWDWGPRVATCGLWKPVHLEAWSGVRIAGVRPLVRRESGSRWMIDVHAELEWSEPKRRDDHGLVALCRLHDGRTTDVVEVQLLPHGSAAAMIRLAVDSPRLWNPRGHGEPHLYHLELLIQPDDNPAGLIDAWESELGFREIHLNTEPDQHGSKFQIEVNGKPIFCKGANWIPEGLFPDDRAPDVIRARLQQAAAANMNMVRVWGGGFYESDEFYQECDRLGLMVWQDFMFACAMYPEEPPFPALIEAEARQQITRLSPHPSVVLWCGGNECVWGHENWGWKERLAPGQSWGAAYWFGLLPRLMHELDPTRPYWPNSPWSAPNLPPNDVHHGDRHTWDVTLNGYRTLSPRFISEVGHQSPSNMETLQRVLKPEELSVSATGEPHPSLEHRQRGTGGTAKHINESIIETSRARSKRTDEPECEDRLLRARLVDSPCSRSFTEWHTLAQQLQADAMTIAIDWAIENRPRCMGILIWQLNDAWPGFSWSLIDSSGREKPAYFAVQKAFAQA